MIKTKLTILMITLILLSSCAFNQVAEYDQNTAYKIVEISKMVNLFYIELADHNLEERQFIQCINDYRQIEVELEALLLMNKIRPLNEESIIQAQNTLELWIKYKNTHKEKDTYSDAQIKLHRDRFNRNFVAMAMGEKLKANDE